MKFIQIVFSPTGGTQKVADTIMTSWDPSFERIDLSDANKDFNEIQLQKEDVALIAVPSFGGRVPELAISRLKEIHGNGAMSVLVCVYGNRAYEDTLVELQDTAEQCGFRTIAAVAAIAEHSIMHQYATGRPDEKDKEELHQFAKQILEKIHTNPSGWTTANIPGNHPYKKAGSTPLIPKADKNCNSCGICAEKCPAQAIDLNNPKETNSKKCISCMRCVSICPQSARKVNGALVAMAALAIKKACSERKNNELYY